eukprot:Opistho-2@88762
MLRFVARRVDAPFFHVLQAALTITTGIATSNLTCPVCVTFSIPTIVSVDVFLFKQRAQFIVGAHLFVQFRLCFLQMVPQKVNLRAEVVHLLRMRRAYCTDFVEIAASDDGGLEPKYLHLLQDVLQLGLLLQHISSENIHLCIPSRACFSNLDELCLHGDYRLSARFKLNAHDRQLTRESVLVSLLRLNTRTQRRNFFLQTPDGFTICPRTRHFFSERGNRGILRRYFVTCLGKFTAQPLNLIIASARVRVSCRRDGFRHILSRRIYRNRRPHMRRSISRQGVGLCRQWRNCCLELKRMRFFRRLASEPIIARTSNNGTRR